ncbi:dihydrofolate reductase family protein [Flindersiella endophytica]
MSKLIVVNYLSLDGRFDYGDWIEPYLDDTVVRAISQATVQAAGMLLGRRTYDSFAAIWPDADESEQAVAAMNRMPKYVVSTTLRAGEARWNGTEVLQAADPDRIRALKRRHDGYLVVFGSGELIQTLMEHDLIDEYRLLVLPIIRGTGRRLFPDRTTTPSGLHLADATYTRSGVLIATYQRERR